VRGLRIGLVAAMLAATVMTPATAAGADTGVPADANAKGFIGLCDQNNHNVTGGSINDTPFVWKAVSSMRPPSSVIGKGQNAVLDIFQPRPQVEAGDWSGDQLTAASFYTDANAPAAQSTLKDIPLSLIVKEYPPLVNGLYELRMFYGITSTANLYSATYPATFIRVSGDRWSVVTGGTVNCAAAGANSLEVATGQMSVKVAYGKPLPAPSGKPSAVATTATAVPPATSAGSGSSSAASAVSGSPVAGAKATKSSSNTGLWVGLAIAAAALAAGAGYWWRRQGGTR